MIKHIFDAVKWDIGIIQSRFVDSGCPILPCRISVYYVTATICRHRDTEKKRKLTTLSYQRNHAENMRHLENIHKHFARTSARKTKTYTKANRWSNRRSNNATKTLETNYRSYFVFREKSTIKVGCLLLVSRLPRLLCPPGNLATTL